MTDFFSVNGGLSFPISLREFGSQDKGLSPKGAQDQLSFNTAYSLLDSPRDFQAVEMIYPSRITANRDLLIVICGASYEREGISSQNILYNQVYKLNKDEVLEFKGTKKGFRTVILAIVFEPGLEKLIGKKRSEKLGEFINLNYRNNFIRVTKGPEFFILKDNTFFDELWSISPNSSQMGLSLNGPSLDTEKIEMISQPVSDGTVQLSPGGPIVLMRYRQTVGGYPRVVNVIEPDISKLAQFAPGSKLRFKLIDLDEAFNIMKDLNEII
ncbi:hydrolase [Francisella halioticida]|uniref:Hydrolase n=1 Tax=Francisella halioticida TaxID=549298 RepID=A0ABM6LWP9_9GAMM|nr:hydrolase [Francisella halioticida]ASG67118.1 hydrolase [Francisella halioticida]BCD91938.1 hydrolase [Francisella halioticida]